MGDTLLLTLRHAAHARTLSVDEGLCGTAYLGLGEDFPASGPLVCADFEDEGLVVRPCGDALLMPLGSERPVAGSIVFERGTSALVGVSAPAVGDDASLYVRPASAGMRMWARFGLVRGADVVMGRDGSCDLWYASRFVSGRHLRLTNREGEIWVTDLGSGNGTYVDGRRLTPMQPRVLMPGSVAQVLDLTLVAGKDFVSMNQPEGLHVRATGAVLPLRPDELELSLDVLRAAGRRHDSFYPAPRLIRGVHPVKVEVDEPPARVDPEGQSLLSQMGPTFLMGLSSVFMAANAVSGLAGGKDALEVAPSIAMAVAMLGGSVVWPSISHVRSRRMARRAEELRVRLYAAYLDEVEQDLHEQAAMQARLLEEARVPVEELLRRAREGSSRLMGHTVTDDDFMELRVGRGDAPLKAQVSWPRRRFSVEEDLLWSKVGELSQSMPMLEGVPLVCSLVGHRSVGVLGGRMLAWEFLRGLVVQLCANHSPHELKLALIADEREREEWSFMLGLAHLYDDSGESRRLALTQPGLVRLDRFLLREADARSVAGQPPTSAVHHVVVCTCRELDERSEAVRRLLVTQDSGVGGFCVIHLASRLQDLPRDCAYIIDLEGELVEDESAARRSAMFVRADMLGSMQRFVPDILVTRQQASDFATDLASLRLNAGHRGATLPKDVGFLELFEVGCVEHLDVGQRWANASAARSLATPLGRDGHGSVVSLDLVEDAQGPHGLIAGTTGSGKSELIITMVLGLCVCYPPDEVSFVLIDYKGGGLAGAFQSDRHCLPHLAGVITNLDGPAIRRSLASLKSELRRRQEFLNQARDLVGEATMDIYRYLALRRQGVLSDPLPHLVIVADEFAELRQQEPEFMDELMSAARIGRSLGVHLVLATQKPTGVVNDQIWSNARFKVCLKVADKADSREMLRRDDAAGFANPGRFCMLVGYDESFEVGQAAYAGRRYVAKERFEPRRDRAVELLDSEGQVVSRMQRPEGSRDGCSELEAVLGHLELLARIAGRRAPRLWLDPLPEHVTLSDLRERYGEPDASALLCVTGELDDPSRQARMRFELNLTELGNVALVGPASSGVEEVVRAMLVSLAQAHSSAGLWIYGVEASGDALTTLLTLPHVGGVVSLADEGAVWSLLRMLERELDLRKGSSVQDVCRMPVVVCALVGPEALLEADPEVEDRLVALTREGPAQAIHFVVAVRSVSALHMRLRTNFGMVVPMALNDESDYLSILGSLEGLGAPKGARRGIVRWERRLLEFQGAQVCAEDEDEETVVACMSHGMRSACDATALPVPRLPEHVLWEDLAQAMGDSRLPVGFGRREVMPMSVELSSLEAMLVAGNDGDSLMRHVRGVHEGLSLAGVAHVALDAPGILGVAGDADVLVGKDQVEHFLLSAEPIGNGLRVVLVVGVVRTLSVLGEHAAQVLRDLIGTRSAATGLAVVVVSEGWRIASVYEDWFRSLGSQPYGVWVGSGFADQTVLRYAPPLPRVRGQQMAMDGYMVERGVARAVRMIEGRGEDER